MVQIRLVFVPLHIISLDQTFNPFLHFGGLQENELVSNFHSTITTNNLTVAGNLICLKISERSKLCCNFFLIFMMRTTAASI